MVDNLVKQGLNMHLFFLSFMFIGRIPKVSMCKIITIYCTQCINEYHMSKRVPRHNVRIWFFLYYRILIAIAAIEIELAWKIIPQQRSTVAWYLLASHLIKDTMFGRNFPLTRFGSDVPKSGPHWQYNNVIACRLLPVKTIPEQMLTYYQKDT